MLPTLKRISLVFIIILSLAFFGYLVYTGMGAKTKASISTDVAGNGEIPASKEGLVAQWNFNETSGTMVRSEGSCGKQCDGQLVNFAYTTSQDAALGTGWTTKNKLWGTGALMFDGVNDYVSVNSGARSQLDIDTNPITLEAWVNPSVTTGVHRILFRGIPGKQGYGLSIGVNGAAKFNLGNAGGGNFDGTTIIQQGAWYHVVGIINGASSQIYVNGKLETTGSVSIVASDERFSIGAGWNGTVYQEFWNGIIDSPRVYTRALSEKEILANFQAQNGQKFCGKEVCKAGYECYQPIIAQPPCKAGEVCYATDQLPPTCRLIPTPTTVDRSVVGFWNMDDMDDASRNITDSSGNGNNGIPKGTTVVTGKLGSARSFNGTSDYISVADSNSLDFNKTFTIESWIYPTNNNSGVIVAKGNSATNRTYAFTRNGSGNLFSWWSQDGNAGVLTHTSKSTVPVNSWSHVAVTYDGGLFRYYINGVLDYSANTSAYTLFNSSAPLTIGYDTGTYPWYFTGSIDAVRIHSRALTEKEIYANFQAQNGNTTPTPQPVGQLTFTLGGQASRTNVCVYTGKISWSTKNVSGIKVTVKGEDEKENTITKEPLSGSAETPWLQSKGKYLFSLYNTNTNMILDTKTVSVPPFACSTPTPTPIPQALTATPVATGSLGGGAQLLFKVRMPDISTSVGTVGNVKIEIKNKTETLFDFTTGLQRIQGTDYFSTPAPIELDIPNGTYTIYVKQLKTVRRSFTANLTRGKTLDCTQKNADTSCQSLGKSELAPLFSGDSDGFLNSAGSYNKIDAADLQKIVAKYGVSPLPAEPNGDFNLDGKIDVQDLGILGKNFGKKGD